MKIDLINSGSEMIAKVSGRIDAVNATQLSKILLEHVDAEDVHVLDFTDVSYLSDEGMSATFYVYNVFVSMKSRNIIRGLNGQPLQKMKTLGFFDILPNE